MLDNISICSSYIIYLVIITNIDNQVFNAPIIRALFTELSIENTRFVTVSVLVFIDSMFCELLQENRRTPVIILGVTFIKARENIIVG